MTSKDDPIPEDVREAFERAAKALFAWSSIGGDESTVIVHGSPTPISMVATLADTYEDTMPADLFVCGAKCLLEWVRDKEAESKVYTPTA